MPTPRPVPLTELRDLTQDEFLRYQVSTDAYACVLDDAWAVLHSWGSPAHGAAVVGAPRATLPLLEHLGEVARDRGIDWAWVSFPAAGPWTLPPGWVARGEGVWEWMWTMTAPDPSGLEDRVLDLDDTSDAAEIRAFGLTHNPRFEGDPGQGRALRWVGIRGDDGALLAIGEAQANPSGYPHLAGVVVHADHRGEGLGRAVMVSLTRWSVERAGAVTLGMYADNDRARSLYHRLGYRTAHTWRTVDLSLPWVGTGASGNG